MRETLRLISRNVSLFGARTLLAGVTRTSHQGAGSALQGCRGVMEGKSYHRVNPCHLRLQLGSIKLGPDNEASPSKSRATNTLLPRIAAIHPQQVFRAHKASTFLKCVQDCHGRVAAQASVSFIAVTDGVGVPVEVSTIRYIIQSLTK